MDIQDSESARTQYCYPYPRPMVTVDAVVFHMQQNRWQVLLIQRRNAPYEGSWALPGGFVDMEETLEQAAVRELEEETGITGVHLEQIRAFSDPHRDPRGRNICVAFAGKLEDTRQVPQGADDAADARWFPLDALPSLAFDHATIVEYAVRWLNP